MLLLTTIVHESLLYYHRQLSMVTNDANGSSFSSYEMSFAVKVLQKSAQFRLI